MYPFDPPLPEWKEGSGLESLSFVYITMVSIGLAGAHVQPVLEKNQLLGEPLALSH